MCPHCNESKKTVDHLASRCGRLLHNNYKERHDEVVRSIHFHYAREYGFAKSNKLRTHKLGRPLVNENVTIRNDEHIITDVKISYNKTDIFIHDKAKNKITIIEVGITSQSLLKTKETEKYRK